MRKIVANLLIGTAITAIGLFGADSFLGTWKWNPAKSKITGDYPVKSRTEVWAATPDGGVKVTRTQQDANGATINFTYTFKYDGKEYPVRGGPFDTVSAKRIDANTASFEVIRKIDGMYHQTGRNVISKDGKTRTLTAKGTDAAGKPIVATVVFDKQ